MALHRDRHKTPEPGCFGCRVLGVGYQGLQSRSGPDPVQRVPVTAEEGPRAGRVVGRYDEHWDGRRDATVHAPRVALNMTAKEIDG